MDEIPTALREIEVKPKYTNVSSNLVILFLSIIGTLCIGLLYLSRNSQLIQADSKNTTIQPVMAKVESNSPDKAIINQKEKLTQPSPQTTSENNSTMANKMMRATTGEQELQPENILGHLPYPEAPLPELKPISYDGKILLRNKAAEKFKAMQADARRNGVILVPISGFRSVAEQEYLFFGIKEERQQVVSKRAEVSAPPGYSEHHTGYAVDIGDGNMPATNLSPRFEQTPAYQWLTKNAAKYSFELSFTLDNLQGISYEPWHWRYIGDTDSLETFYKARNLTTDLNSN
jgi:D-alanyl-D-alanine carboxypeptidase